MPQQSFGWQSGETCDHHPDVLDPIVRLLLKAGARRVLDIGSGNGSLTRALAAAGFTMVGLEPDSDGIEIARHHGGEYVQLSVYDEPNELGTFDAAVCVEVIEHLFQPSAVPRFAAKVLPPGSPLIVTTPYHGYAKNLLIAATGRWDVHVDALQDGGHIKFFSRASLARLLLENGFTPTGFEGTGRAPFLWRSMIMTATRD
jgi:2-polyprenyl-3-methyl-5-hydroxy-6-metoxy-1,4-benzoquinol methylase